MGVVMRMPPTVKQEDAGGKRCAVRFPIHLPVRVMVDGQEYEANTENMSANGVLLRLNSLLEVGTRLEFLIEIPAGALGLQQTAAMHCIGKVIRAYGNAPDAYAAAVIEEYRFQ
jgi:hypothetical protein